MLPRLPRTYVGLLAIGGIFAVLGGSCELLGIAAAISPARGQSSDGGLAVVAFATIVFVIPAAVLLGFGLHRRRRVLRLEKLDALAMVSARLPLDTVARELGFSVTEARALILEAVGQGLLRGRLDLEKGIFYSAEADASFPQQAFHCRRCGSTSQITVVPGQWPVCPYCHTPG